MSRALIKPSGGGGLIAVKGGRRGMGFAAELLFATLLSLAPFHTSSLFIISVRGVVWKQYREVWLRNHPKLPSSNNAPSSLNLSPLPHSSITARSFSTPVTCVPGSRAAPSIWCRKYCGIFCHHASVFLIRKEFSIP